MKSQMKPTIERDKTIDVARGIGILFVILGHCFYSLDNPINKIILSFHMPLFFFLSGLVAKTYDSKIKSWKYLYQKIKTFLLPQLFLGLITYIYDLFFILILKGGNFNDVDLLYSIWRWWFLQVLLLTTLSFYFISKFVNFSNRRTRLLVIVINIVIIILVTYMIPFPDESPFYINIVPMAYLFYFIGYCMKAIISNLSNGLKYRNTLNQSKYKGIEISISIIAAIVLIAASQINSQVTMYNNGYGNIVLFLLCSVSGILLVLIVSRIFQYSHILKWCGVNSVVIYVWQFKLTEFWKNIAEVITDKIVPASNNNLMTIIAFIFSTLTVVPIVWFSNRYIPFLYGKRKV